MCKFSRRSSGICSQGLKSIVHAYEPERIPILDGASMFILRKFTWQSIDNNSDLLIKIIGVINHDSKYGLRLCRKLLQG